MPQLEEQLLALAGVCQAATLVQATARTDNNSKDKDTELTRYVASILGLERKLSSNPNAMNELAQRISHVQRQSAHVGFENQQIINALASIYSDVVSPLAPKIKIAGTPAVLGIEGNQSKVRALLLAGIRSSVLWRQLGGKRRYILFARNKLLNASKQIMRAIN